MGVIICMILLVILCFIVLELEYEKGENKVSVTREDMLTKRSKTTIIEVKKKLEDKYYEIVDDFEQVISDFNPPDINWDLKEFNIIRGWNRGSLSSADALEKLNKMDIQKAALSKVCHKFYRLIDMEGIDPKVVNKAKEVADRLKVEVVPSYEKYLSNFRFFLNRMKKIDKDQIKLIHGRTTKDSPCQVRNVTLNQAIRFIKANGLASRDEKYIMHDYTVTFENKTLENGTMYSTEIDWFVCPNPYVNIIADLFDIDSYHSFGTSVESDLSFYNKLEETIKKQLGA